MNSDEKLFTKAKALHIKGEIRDAQEIYLRLLKKNSNNSNLLFLIGTTYVQQKKYQKGKKYLNISIKINSNFPESYNSRGIIFAEEADYSNTGNYLSIYENVRIDDIRGNLIADKLLFDIKKQKLDITSFNDGKINANIKLNEKRF